MPGTDDYGAVSCRHRTTLTHMAALDAYSGKDALPNQGRLQPGDPSRRAFAYFMMGTARSVKRHVELGRQ